MRTAKSSRKKKRAASPRSRRDVVLKSPSRLRTPRPEAPPKGAPVRTPTAVVASKRPFKPGLKLQLEIPPILLEGDKPEVAPIGGPGQKYAIGPVPPAERLEEEGELSEAYGTRRLLLIARDPHWLYAHWDFTREQLRHYNLLSAERHLTLRIHVDRASDRPVAEVPVHPESRHWFVHVDRPATKYVVELGYYRKSGRWVTIVISGSARTPPAAMSDDTSAEFAFIPFELPMAKLLALAREAAPERVPLAKALHQLRVQGHPELPAPPMPWPAQWTPAQERALAEVISMELARTGRVLAGTLEITELVRRQFVQELSSLAAVQPGGAPSGVSGVAGSPEGPFGAISSPFGGEGPARGFWFKVNAELVVYGATEPDATVTIGGQAIKLRPDGSFSIRFALPDGQYELAITAVSADRTEGRAAEMKFSRGTEYRGDVGTYPLESGLQQLLWPNF